MEHVQREAPCFSGRRPARFFASTFYHLNGQEKEKYRFGDEGLLHAGGQYPLVRQVDVLGQVVARWRDRDHAGESGELVDATGGTFLYLSPGLQLQLREGLALYGYYQVPVHRKVSGVQLTADRNLFLGFGYYLH